MFRIVWIEATNDMDGLQAVGDRRCGICDLGRTHLATAIFSHELNPTHRPACGSLTPFRVFINFHSTTANHRTYFFTLNIPSNISSYSLLAVIPSPDKPFPLIEFPFFQDFCYPMDPSNFHI